MDQDRRSIAFPWWMPLVLVFAAPAVLALGFTLGRQMLSSSKAEGSSASSPSYVSAEDGDKYKPVTELPADLFKGWAMPDIALVLSGQTFGYLQPCGCSSPQYGGLVRRYNVVKMLEKKGWKVAGVDLGEIYPPKVDLPVQAMEKFKTIIRAMDVMNYQDYGLGLPEMKMPLSKGLTEAFALNVKQPRPLSLDLQDPNKLFEALSVRSYDVIGGGPVKVGVASVVGPSVEQAMAGNPDVKFFANAQMLPILLSRLAKEKTDVVVLLVNSTKIDGKHMGESEAEAIAKQCEALRQKNPSLPAVDLIIHTSDFDTPPSRPQLVEGTNTRLLFMGHKAKYIGVLGLFRKPAGGFELKYELVSLSPSFETPEGQAKDHPVMKIMEDYALTVKDGNFLDAYKVLRTEHPTQKNPLFAAGDRPRYVGSETCGECHPAAYKVWKDSKHSHAYETLENVKNPGLRQFDPECIVCHTVGFQHPTGYFDPPVGANPKQIDKHNEKLRNVGCESCHGPGSMHANDPKNAKYHPLINPIKLNNPNNNLKLDFFCQTCHDIENDVHWGQKKTFQDSWRQIAHPRPKDE